MIDMKDNTVKAILKIKEKDRTIIDCGINGEKTEGFINYAHTMCIAMDGLTPYKNDERGNELKINTTECARVMVSVDLLKKALSMCDDYVTLILTGVSHGTLIVECHGNKMDDCKVVIAPRLDAE